MEFIPNAPRNGAKRRSSRRSRTIEPSRFLFLVDQPLSSISFSFRLILWVIFLIMGVGFLLKPLSPEMMSPFWHSVNLPFHEAGHVLFSWLPPVMVSFMGSGMQLLMPLVCGFALMFKTEDLFGTSICLWWFGQNFLDIAPYINDARSGTLPLLGGNTGENAPYGFHDWEFILGELKLLKYDHTIANLSVFAGKLIIAAALAWGGVILFRAFKNRNWSDSSF